MKKISCILLSLVLSLPLWAQGQVSTRKHKLADFTDKVTQVVLTGNEMLSSALREEVVSGWTASAFEFSTLDRFEKIKSEEKYYFLMVAESGGISFLTLLKGDPEAKEKGISAMHEVISLPLVAAMGGSGRELTGQGFHNAGFAAAVFSGQGQDIAVE